MKPQQVWGLQNFEVQLICSAVIRSYAVLKLKQKYLISLLACILKQIFHQLSRAIDGRFIWEVQCISTVWKHVVGRGILKKNKPSPTDLHRGKLQMQSRSVRHFTFHSFSSLRLATLSRVFAKKILVLCYCYKHNNVSGREDILRKKKGNLSLKKKKKSFVM